MEKNNKNTVEEAGIVSPDLMLDNGNETEKNEKNDSGKIEKNPSGSSTVTLRNPEIPLVIMFGPKTIGKTVAIIRLVRYLRSEGYEVDPDKGFRRSDDKRYEEACNNFKEISDPTNHGKPKSTPNTDYMLLQVKRNAELQYQILDAAGEDFFKGNDREVDFPQYLQNIIQESRKLIWVFFVTKEWMGPYDDKVRYIGKVNRMKTDSVSHVVLPDHKVIFLCTRVDDRAQGVAKDNNNPPRPIYNILHKEVRKEYKNEGVSMFEPYDNHHLILKCFWKYNYSFLPYSACTLEEDGTINWHDGDNFYPKMLWGEICNKKFRF